MRKKFILSEDTKVSIGFIMALVGGVVWLSHIAFLADSNASALDEVNKKQDMYSKDIIEIKADLKYIRQRIDAP